MQERGMTMVEADASLVSGDIETISQQAARRLMDTGYIPSAILQKVNGWLAEYRAAQAEKPDDAAH